MNKIWIIARHEYWVNLRRPGFLIMTALVPLLGFVALLVGTFFSGQAGNFLQQIFVSGSRLNGVVDQSGQFTPILPDYQEQFILFADVEAGRAAVASEDIRRLLVIPPDYMQTGEITVVSDEGSFGGATVDDSTAIRDFFIAHLLRNENDVLLRTRLLQPYDPVMVTSSDGSQSSNGALGQVLAFIVPYMLSILLIITIFSSSGYLLRSVSQEKTNRVIEVILSSVSARELLAGKVLGLGALGLTQVIVWLVSALALSGGVVGLLGVAIPLLARPEVFFLAIVYYLFGFLIYAVLMGSVGALGTNMQESQQMAGIFSLMASVPFMLAGVVFSNPNGTIVRVLSWFPLTAPTMMMLRLPMAEVPVLDIVGSLVMVALAVPAILWLGAKIFRMGLLMYGKRPSVIEILRSLRAA